jgi:hypothetical protein
MKTQQNIEVLIEKIRLYMPSYGSWPVTVISINRKELEGLSFEPRLLGPQQLLFLIRTDFNKIDLTDFVSNTKEFTSIPMDRREDYLDHYAQKISSNADIINWSKKIANLSIGLATWISEDLDLCIEHIEANLYEMDTHFRFADQNLKAYQLFEVYSCTY